MLSNAARLARSHFGAANVIEQRGLAMVDVPHDRHDRGTWRNFRNRFAFVLANVSLGVVEFGRLRRMAHFLNENDRSFLVENLVDRNH